MTSPIIFWFRQDLRLKDHPGLLAAEASGRPLIALYILDDDAPGDWCPGGASRWWLHHSLSALADTLQQEHGIRLLLRRGKTRDVLQTLIEECDAHSVYCTRRYEPWAAAQETALHEQMERHGVCFKRFPGTLLFEPGRIRTQSDEPYKVFTPFWRSCREQPEPAMPREAPTALAPYEGRLDSDSLGDWGLTPTRPNWARGFEERWKPGPEGAADRLADFLGDGLGDYDDGRNRPARNCVSRLSPHLHHGEISPRAVWHAAQERGRKKPALANQVDKFLSELGWREFSYHLLHFFPDIPEAPFKAQFADFPWQTSKPALRAWQRGQTGYPMVDAGMRELWHTGYMHNRVRMLTASFLTKHLRLHWRHGEEWFWDTLVDADLANNAAGWQWVAGSGADAAPYFRIFNPVTQGEKFDGDGEYVRRWVPELADLPDKYLHRPFDAPDEVLEAAGIALGDTYPKPLVEHKAAREAALEAYSQTRKGDA